MDFLAENEPVLAIDIEDDVRAYPVQILMWQESHFTGQGIVGELTAVELETFPVVTVPWGVWRDAHPDGLVLSRDTGFTRDYGRNPYPGYDDIGATGVFVPIVDGRALTFACDGDGDEFVDDQTGSTWKLLGQAVDGALAGSTIDAVAHVDTFWFAWSAFRPDSAIIGR